MVWEEAQLVVERMNQELASSTALFTAAIGGALSKKGNAELKKVLKELTGG